MKKSGEVHRVQSRLLHQNVYARDVERCDCLDPVAHDYELKYEDLKDQVTEEGVKQFRVIQDYPITPAYVSSFAASCDYKTDPQGNLSRQAPRKNLGDVTRVQDLSGMDSATLEQVMRELLDRKAKAVLEAQQSAEKAGAEASVDGGE
uniref:Uncharacterized protein n=1 Tax=Dulem virus 209 TaxID=3145686 RepID=A0AAU8B7R3_9VIRU